MPVKFMRRSDGSTGTIPENVYVDVALYAADVDVDVWVADGDYELVEVAEAHSVVGGVAAAVRPRKITDTSAPGAVAGATVKELTTANIDLTASINTVRRPTLVATKADRKFKRGDRLALDYSGTLTGLVGHATFVLKRLSSKGASY